MALLFEHMNPQELHEAYEHTAHGNNKSLCCAAEIADIFPGGNNLIKDIHAGYCQCCGRPCTEGVEDFDQWVKRHDEEAQLNSLDDQIQDRD